MWFAPNENNLPDNRGRFSVKGLAHCVCWTPLPQFQQQKGVRASGFDNFTVLSNFQKLTRIISTCCCFSYSLYLYLPYRSRSKEKDSIDPLTDKKKIKEEKEDEKVEDVSSTC